MTRARRGAPDVPVALEAAEFRALGHALVDEITGFLEALPARRVAPAGGPAELRALLGGLDARLPDAGAPADELLRTTARLLFEHSTFNAHPRFFGYITASPTPVGVLGELLAAAVNPNCGAWTLAPLATEIEAQTVRWIAELIGYPRACGGLLVSGGNVANFTCLLAARVAAAGQEIRAHGLATPHAPRLAVYASAETHTWIQKAADMYGLGTDAIRWIPTDGRQRMAVDALRATLEADAAHGVRPLMVVGTAGSVSTGAVDPLHELAELCRARGIWFHVDGAYGAFAAAVPGASPEFTALAAADSVAVDPHKWLYAPLEAGCALVRDPAMLRDAFAYHPPYYHFGIEATNYVDQGEQNSRGFRALKVWLALRHAGRTGYVRMIGDDIALARRLYDNVAAHAELEAVTHALSITTFRFVPPKLRARAGQSDVEAYLDRLNRALLDRLQKGGEAFVSNAVIDGRYVLRACIVNFNTTVQDVDALPEIVVRVGREIDRKLRVSSASSLPQ